MNYNYLLDQVKEHVVQFFNTKVNRNFVYHNLSHTEAVVANATNIAVHYRLSERDFFIIITAAWFHDTGYFEGEPPGHEERGAELAAAYLATLAIDEQTIREIKDCILATRMPQSPRSLNEQIVCDADLFHFGTEHFPERNKLMRKEAEWKLGRRISKEQWRSSTVKFMEAHHYHTEYCRNLLDAKKKQNLSALKKKPAKDPSPAQLINPVTAITTSTVQDQPKKQKSDRPDRGIETMFRVTSNNHQRLSDMADNKAHIMITTTSIIISVLLSVLLRKLEDNPHLIIPTLILLVVCVVTMVFSILATRPNLPPGTFSRSDVESRRVNLLFFGNFYRMSFEDYDDGMRQMMNDRDFLYGSLTRDVYSQGIVLGRKYRLLRKGYNVFMYGIIASVIAFFVASVFFG